MTDTPQRATEYGEQAAMRGLSQDDCPYRLHDLCACWLRGWHAWHQAAAGAGRGGHRARPRRPGAVEGHAAMITIEVDDRAILDALAQAAQWLTRAPGVSG